MSYRASLERKCRFLLGTGTLILITASFWFYARQTEDIAFKTTKSSGRLLIGPVLFDVHEENFASRDALHQFKTMLEKRWEKSLGATYAYRIIKPNARKPANQPDPEEAAVIERFIQDPSHEEETRHPPKDESIFYYAAIRAIPQCLQCHPTSKEEREELGDLKEGDLMGVVRIKLSSQAIESDVHLNRALMITIALVTSVLIMTGTYLIVRYVIVKPVKHLKQVADAIAAGETNVRSEIQTGDEFEDLSYAFNRMLRNLMAKESQLKEVNSDLDRKLDELARANMALYESNRLKSDFLATMSHELRTPLNSILGFSDLMLANAQTPDKQRRWAGNIQTSGRQLLALINDLLDLAKIEAGKMEVRPETIDVAEICENLLAMFRPLAEKKNIDLRSSMAVDLPPATQDAGKLRQILSNLLSNAIKFTPEGGRVSLSAEASGQNLLLTVSDTGVGIAEEDQEAVFDKFRQAANPLTREHAGTGLGLSIVRELSKLLGGEVTLKSELGRGSTFTVRLPLELRQSARYVYQPPAGVLADGPDAVAGMDRANAR